MSVLTARGGVPHVFRDDAISSTGRTHTLPFTSNFLIVRVMVGSAKAARLYFSKADYDVGKNYIFVPIPAAATPNGEWAGPVEVGDVWLAADTAGDVAKVELVAFQRRG